MNTIYGSLEIRTTIISNNSAGIGGGLYNTKSSPTLAETTVCGNTPEQILGGYTDNGGNCISEFCADCDTCPADLDQDGDVGGADLTQVLTEWGCTGQDCTADLDGSGTVDGADLTIILTNWGPCPG